MNQLDGEIRILTSLRFFAAALIVALHLSVSYKWAWLHYVPAASALGVTFFFVLSGFILTHVYRQRRASFAEFMWARFSRIWPLHASVLVAILGAYWLGILPSYSVTFSGPFPFEWPQTFLANVLLLHSLAPWTAYTFSWDAVSWSVSTELFFYLVFPFLLVRIDTTWHWKLLGALAVSLLWTIGVYHFADANATGPFAVKPTALLYPSPIARITEFVSGMALYVLWERSRNWTVANIYLWTALEVAVISMAAFYIIDVKVFARFWPQGALGYFIASNFSAVPFLLLVGVMAHERGAISRILRHDAFVFLGEISFAMYLTHHFLIRLLGPTLSPMKPLFATLVFVSVLLLASTLSFKLIEKRARRFLRSIPGTTPRLPSMLTQLSGEGEKLTTQLPYMNQQNQVRPVQGQTIRS